MERVRVKILGISCAHRPERNAAWLVLYALKALERSEQRMGQVARVDAKLFDLAGKAVRP